MEYNTSRGKILYVHDERGERGREWFTLTTHPNGDRTVRAMCELYDVDLLRDVIYTVDINWKPIDAYIRLTLKDIYIGSGWFRFTEHKAECETFMKESGRISQWIDLDERPLSFGTHPVICDVWHIGAFDRKSKSRIQTLKGTMVSSPLHTGASGPLLSPVIMSHKGTHLNEFSIEYMGTEEITVPAGTFQADHFRYLLGEHPSYEIWCHGEHLIPVKLRWDFNETTYYLEEFEVI